MSSTAELLEKANALQWRLGAHIKTCEPEPEPWFEITACDRADMDAREYRARANGSDGNEYQYSVTLRMDMLREMPPQELDRGLQRLMSAAFREKARELGIRFVPPPARNSSIQLVNAALARVGRADVKFDFAPGAINYVSLDMAADASAPAEPEKKPEDPLWKREQKKPIRAKK